MLSPSVRELEGEARRRAGKPTTALISFVGWEPTTYHQTARPVSPPG
jgi:hypothetical protein